MVAAVRSQQLRGTGSCGGEASLSLMLLTLLLRQVVVLLLVMVAKVLCVSGLELPMLQR